MNQNILKELFIRIKGLKNTYFDTKPYEYLLKNLDILLLERGLKDYPKFLNEKNLQINNDGNINTLTKDIIESLINKISETIEESIGVISKFYDNEMLKHTAKEGRIFEVTSILNEFEKRINKNVIEELEKVKQQDLINFVIGLSLKKVYIKHYVF